MQVRKQQLELDFDILNAKFDAVLKELMRDEC